MDTYTHVTETTLDLQSCKIFDMLYRDTYNDAILPVMLLGTTICTCATVVQIVTAPVRNQYGSSYNSHAEYHDHVYSR